jgi:uncharacterized membrane protein SpoIIM required for sporulation
MAPGELDELVARYQQVSAHLAHARVSYDDPTLHARLNRVVAEANAVIYGRRGRASSTFARFFVASFPAAVFSSGRFVGVAAAFLFGPAIVIGAWLANDERALDIAVDPTAQEALLESEFEGYYSSSPAQNFSTHVMVNNIIVSFNVFALGALACVPGVALLAYDSYDRLGPYAGLFIANGEGGRFFGLILPHGLLELTAVTIAAAAGLRIGWALLAPGDRTRATAMAEEGRRSVVLVLGCVLAFVVAGIIEGFVTPAPISTAARVGVGVLVESLFLLWVVGFGRRAVDDGFTGLPADDQRAWDARKAAPGAQSRPVALASR